MKLGIGLILDRLLLRQLVAKRFPYILVDESQDASPGLVQALTQVAADAPGFCVGFFGDPMQKIYTAGAGAIALGEGWEQITKPENFRCPQSVLGVINRIRAEDDGLQQVRGRTEERGGIMVPVQGSARLFIAPIDDRRHERLTEIRHLLARQNRDPLWQSDRHDGDVRILVLVHRMAARRLNFENLYSALHDNGAANLNEGLTDGTAWVLKPFLNYVLPLVIAAKSDAAFEAISALRVHSPLLEKERLREEEAARILGRLRNDVAHLVEMFTTDQANSIRAVLKFLRDRGLIRLDERYTRFLAEPFIDDDNAGSEDVAVPAFLECSAAELWGYRIYIEDESPFATQQGIKGAEFQRVMVVLDDEEGDCNYFPTVSISALKVSPIRMGRISGRASTP